MKRAARRGPSAVGRFAPTGCRRSARPAPTGRAARGFARAPIGGPARPIRTRAGRSHRSPATRPRRAPTRANNAARRSAAGPESGR